MSKRRDKAHDDLRKWILDICFENVPRLIDDCIPVACKGCGKQSFRKDDIKHKRGCDAAKALRNLKILKESK